jgi:hypothetical protein
MITLQKITLFAITIGGVHCIMIFWVMTKCRVMGGHLHFGGAPSSGLELRIPL